MVQFSEQLHTFEAPLDTVALGHNLRFPSPYSTHVGSSDVISRTIDPSTSVIRTTRLVLKKGKVPTWAPRMMLKIGTSWVLEESELDLEAPPNQRRELRVRSRNIDHKTIMEVFEWQTYTSSEDDSTLTNCKTLTRVTSEFGFWPLRYRIEKFGIGRVPKSSEKARTGLELILSILGDNHQEMKAESLASLTSKRLLNSGPLNPYPFEPLPFSLKAASGIVRARFDEARAAALGRREGQHENERDEDYQLRLTRDREYGGIRRSPTDSVGGRGGDGGDYGGEPGKIWRDRWRGAARRGIQKFRDRVCVFTGLLCDDDAGRASGYR